ncbi:cob(I)yrinic acid a,c-diamide adenosyltransferase [Streptomyces incarnatus]|uniref:cob(I)yrinic acid a,c-diamide adenosyltransferase n=1 Tax=Streptomyces incarnatus TaxID=665007 RepID=UPI000A54BE5C|nr:cob(I)yrinic acid a,c-diamide adenosyltransferase [Streptomyces incarnatus]
MVNLTRIYTKTGDDGTTALGDMSRVSKTDSRIAAYADVDEANSAIGLAIAVGELDAETSALLLRIQNDLFDVGADLCTPLEGADPNAPALRVEPAYIRFLEEQCDRRNEGLTTLRSFILPGGSRGASYLHLARTVVRRAERSTWIAIEQHGDTMNKTTAHYLNRLSDLLFILARAANCARGDIPWQPGANR